MLCKFPYFILILFIEVGTCCDSSNVNNVISHSSSGMLGFDFIAYLLGVQCLTLCSKKKELGFCCHCCVIVSVVGVSK